MMTIFSYQYGNLFVSLSYYRVDNESYCKKDTSRFLDKS